VPIPLHTVSSNTYGAVGLNKVSRLAAPFYFWPNAKL
jgi:hypothetical protein